MITAKVKHSQRLSVPPVKTWVAAEKGGAVICPHCDCMAGLGEACSHIAAILFTLDANVQARKSLSCTLVPCSWLPPTFKNVPFAPISEINFAEPEKRLKAMAGTSSSSKCFVSSACEGEGTSSSSKTLTNLTSSKSELEHFFKKLSDTSKKPVKVLLVPEYSDVYLYVPLYKKGSLPKPLTDYCENKYKELNFPDLLAQCEVFIQLEEKKDFQYLTMQISCSL